MNAPAPSPDDFSLDTWAKLVALVIAVGTVVVAIWRYVVMPAVKWAARRVLKHELEIVNANNESLQTVGRQYAELIVGMEDIRGEVEKIRNLITNELLNGRGGGPRRRKYDK